MRRFTATNGSEAVVSADRTRIWQALTDPEPLPKLTPLLRRIDTDGDVWRWHLARLSVLGVDIATTCTVVHLELPLPRLAEPEITATMRSTMRRIGDRFSANLLRHLDAREVASWR